MELTLRFSAGFMKVISWFLGPFFWIATLGRQKRLPAITNRLLFLSATSVADKIRKREVKSEDVVKAYIERIKQVNPVINAVVEDRFLDALDEARAVDRYLDSSITNLDDLKKSQPLFGVPLTVKESCAVRGLSYSVGSKVRLGMKASEDGNAVKLLREAGAIPLLVSNTPEYSMYWESNNLVTGCTKNPYKTSRSAAGSSGGEGALIGSGASVVGVGSDLAGSIRLPALFNGVFGHKATSLVVPLDGHFPISNNPTLRHCLSIGPMTRYAEDLPLMLNVMTGKEGEKLNLSETVDLKDLNVFYMTKFGKSLVYTSVSREIKSLVQDSVDHLHNNCGSTLMDQKFDMDDTCEACSLIMFTMKDNPKILSDPINGKVRDNLGMELLKSLFGASKYSRNGLYTTLMMAMKGLVPTRRTEYYEDLIKELREDFLDKLQDNGVFIYPTFPTAAYQHNKFLFHINGVMYLAIFNLLGFPCTHIPMGLNSEGLPIGIQVAAAPNQDRLCLAVAKELEKSFGGWIPPS